MTFKEAVKFVCRIRFGYIQELREDIGSSNVNLLQTTGFLSCGKNYDGEQMQDTWKVTRSADDYCKAMYGGVFSRM